MVRFYGYADHERTGELAEVLMQAAADKDDETKNGSPLICAASHGDVAVVRALSTLAPTSNCSTRTLHPTLRSACPPPSGSPRSSTS